MQKSGIKIDINSENLLLDNSEKIEKVIKFAVKQAVLQKESKTSPQKSSNVQAHAEPINENILEVAKPEPKEVKRSSSKIEPVFLPPEIER